MDGYPEVRLRRLRRTAAIRDMFGMDAPSPSKFIWPVFVVPGEGRREAIASMPGQFRLSADELVKELAPVVAQGVKSVLLFGQHEGDGKDECGTPAADPHGAVQRAIPFLRRAYPDLVILTDVCLCAYTAHGHCGPHDLDGDIDNDAACEMLARVAVSHAQAGADGVAPSAMMDGQIAAIRHALDDEGFKKTLLISYSTKFASQMYGPFRDAENSAPSKGDRQGYQASYRDPRTALRESDFDAAEGADALMVKPALFYLDLIREVSRRSLLPVMAYNVSGEYSMVHAAAEKGYCDLYATARESLYAIFRAGATQVISYWAPFYKEIFFP
ncbi:MAG: porphobilinogen synthase [Kiritimatiellae bacterium]|nr:porphobilinogen synthase [Kiritimatiellia bacterium]